VAYRIFSSTRVERYSNNSLQGLYAILFPSSTVSFAHREPACFFHLRDTIISSVDDF